MKQLENMSTFISAILKSVNTFITVVCSTYAVQNMQQQLIPIQKALFLK